jgi:hypothetical protein
MKDTQNLRYCGYGSLHLEVWNIKNKAMCVMCASFLYTNWTHSRGHRYLGSVVQLVVMALSLVGPSEEFICWRATRRLRFFFFSSNSSSFTLNVEMFMVTNQSLIRMQLTKMYRYCLTMTLRYEDLHCTKVLLMTLKVILIMRFLSSTSLKGVTCTQKGSNTQSQ